MNADMYCFKCCYAWLETEGGRKCPRCLKEGAVDASGLREAEQPKVRVFAVHIQTAAMLGTMMVYGTDMRAALKALRRKLKDESFEPVEITIKLTDLEPQL